MKVQIPIHKNAPQKSTVCGISNLFIFFIRTTWYNDHTTCKKCLRIMEKEKHDAKS
jgi:hypothetical protein